MITVENQLFSTNSVIIQNLPTDNQRKVTKIKLFLNANHNISYRFINNDLNIEFSFSDEVLLWNELTKILNFIESQYNIKILLDKEIETNIQSNKNRISTFNEVYSKLSYLKKNDAYLEDNDFINYSRLCDETLNCKLRPYQYKSSYFLTIGRGGFDFSVPGSGKTIISYAAYNFLKTKDLCNSILIIGPINAFNAWYDEYITCFHNKPSVTSLANVSMNDATIYLLSSRKNHSEITFINIDKAWRLKGEILHFLKNKNTLLIIDEAHKEKNPNAQITKAVLQFAKKVEFRIVLTGTPLPNGYEDLYTLTKIYEPYEKILPFTYYDLVKLTKNGTTPLQQQKIMDSIKPLFSRVSKAYLLNTGELLPPVNNNIKCDLSYEQKIVYDFLNDIARGLDNDFENILNINLMKAILIRKMQVSANPGLLSKSIISSIEEYKKEYYDEFEQEDSNNEGLIVADKVIKNMITQSKIADIIHKFEMGYYTTPKNETASNIAIKLANKGEKVIIWETFVDNMIVLKNQIKKTSAYEVEIINGSIGGTIRQEVIDRFKYGSSMILVANPATLAESISLHKVCQNAIYVNRNFNAGQFMQSKDRIHRINMPTGRTANYYFLNNENTVDDCVHQRLVLKENRMTKILDSDDIEIGGHELEVNSFMSLEDVFDSYDK